MVVVVRTVPFDGVTVIVCRTARRRGAGGGAASARAENSSADVTTSAAWRGRIERRDTRGSLVERVSDPSSKATRAPSRLATRESIATTIYAMARE